MKIKDEIAACRMTMKLWAEISKINAENLIDKTVICNDLFGPHMMHNCPCCEYVDQHYYETIEAVFSPTMVDCKKCPMTDFWSDKEENTFGYTCENEDSPYELWRQKIKNDFGDASPEFRAREIGIIALKAMQYWQSMKEMNIIW